MLHQFYVKLVSFIPRLLVGIFIFCLFLLLAFVLGKLLKKVFLKSGLDKVVSSLVIRILKWTVIIIGSITALGTLGINVQALVAGLGLTGFALGLAFKDFLSNTIAGILIIIYKPFKLGDTIKISSFEGKVVDINLRYTVLEVDDKKIFIPNSQAMTTALIVRKSN